MTDRETEIKGAYKSLGKAHSFYDGMMTCSTVYFNKIDELHKLIYYHSN
ncbi:hypothetical protein [Pseudobutyrivibrio xylanivorans]|nr:hypothetical protein [Pseudobutyrivibrio xylanivorans]